jgi:ADP-ribose pyrophosphatase
MRSPVDSDLLRELPSAGAPPSSVPAPRIQRWEKLGSRAIGDFRIFQLRADRVVSPRTKVEHEMYVIQTVDWVNVIAVTPDQQLVMVEQYRHGSDTIELEIPGGMIDPQDPTPIAAGLRELREETGYEGTNPRIIGRIYPNPAIQENSCYTVMVDQCQLRHPIQMDHGEDLATRLVPIAEIPQLVASGGIQHSLVVVALYYFELVRHFEGQSIVAGAGVMGDQLRA